MSGTRSFEEEEAMALSSWMDQIRDDRRLNQIVLPATHDSGMSFQSWQASTNYVNPLAAVVKPIAGVAGFFSNLISPQKMTLAQDNFVTQSSTVGEQLMLGARQFDLRMTDNTITRNWHAFHGETAQVVVGLRQFGEKWDDICAGIAEWFRDRQSEFIVLKLDKQSTSDAEPLMEELHAALTKARVPNGARPTLTGFVDQKRISDLRGRILVCGKPKFTDACKKFQNIHKSLTFCDWIKLDKGEGCRGLTAASAPIDRFQYILLGSSEGSESKWNNVLDKQGSMRGIFQAFAESRTARAGMRGIWFNTFSLVRDIRTYSDEIWSLENSARRDALWLAGDSIQNVASLDFLDANKALYVLWKNPEENWKPGGVDLDDD
jgi:hypothetical protein